VGYPASLGLLISSRDRFSFSDHFPNFQLTMIPTHFPSRACAFPQYHFVNSPLSFIPPPIFIKFGAFIPLSVLIFIAYLGILLLVRHFGSIRCRAVLRFESIFCFLLHPRFISPIPGVESHSIGPISFPSLGFLFL